MYQLRYSPRKNNDKCQPLDIPAPLAQAQVWAIKQKLPSQWVKKQGRQYLAPGRALLWYRLYQGLL
jgi:hypothetical protein